MTPPRARRLARPTRPLRRDRARAAAQATSIYEAGMGLVPVVFINRLRPYTFGTRRRPAARRATCMCLAPGVPTRATRRGGAVGAACRGVSRGAPLADTVPDGVACSVSSGVSVRL